MRSLRIRALTLLSPLLLTACATTTTTSTAIRISPMIAPAKIPPSGTEMTAIVTSSVHTAPSVAGFVRKPSSRTSTDATVVPVGTFEGVTVNVRELDGSTVPAPSVREVASQEKCASTDVRVVISVPVFQTRIENAVVVPGAAVCGRTVTVVSEHHWARAGGAETPIAAASRSAASRKRTGLIGPGKRPGYLNVAGHRTRSAYFPFCVIAIFRAISLCAWSTTTT